MKSFVPLRRPIPAGSGDVQYGLNAVLPVDDSRDIRNLSWALITRPDTTPTLIVDINGDGDLSNDPHLDFAEEGPAAYSAVQELRVADKPGTGVLVLPVLWTVKKNSNELNRIAWRERRGEFAIGEDRYLFALRTYFPTFDTPGSLIAIDLNRDGTLDPHPGDVEVFRVEDEFVPLGGQEYKRVVDRLGDSLTLTPTGRRAEPRTSLAIGTKAPVLPGGAPLAHGRGIPVLVNFWSPKCSSSKRMAPQLQKAWKAVGGIAFISVTNVPSEDAAEFARAAGHEWPQISGREGQRLFDLYRIAAVPTYYVVDAEGIIRAHGSTLDWPQIESEMARLSSAKERPLEARGSGKSAE
ncbi:MAG: TlpA family protein disulfide reductase [Acidobacteria bacterium]|nr:TlpA family protein disulfide reductase [Acidobacteriota bacterium]